MGCAGIATGNTSWRGWQELISVNKFAGMVGTLWVAHNIFSNLRCWRASLSPIIAATLGVSSLTVGGLRESSRLRSDLENVVAGQDAVGRRCCHTFIDSLIFEPTPSMALGRFPRSYGTPNLIDTSQSYGLFDGLFISGAGDYPFEYLCIPFLVWAAFRLGQREAAIAMLVLCAIAIWGTLHGFGPFARASHNEALLFLQMFLGIISVVTTAFAAALSERQRAEEQAQFLAASDPLTGLGNYRRLFDTLQAEIKRADRSQRTFAFLLLDLDGLKKINDTHGHNLVGNRGAGHVPSSKRFMRTHCREIDSAARYGGDEFARSLFPKPGSKKRVKLHTTNFRATGQR